LATGIDSKQSFVFVQSTIRTYPELVWILVCCILLYKIQRVTQFKEKSHKQKEQVSVGLFNYPALMAADILVVLHR
jgi:tryptophanyl-tRNA synthetase